MSQDLQQFTAAPVADTKRDKTRGEQLFDWSVYGGIGWVVNAAISLVALDWFEYNKTGQKVAEKGKEAIGTLLKPIVKDPEKLTKYKNMGFFITALYSGGTLLIPVMKFFEDHKGWWVRTADRTLHGAAAETDPKLIEAHKEMDDAPKQSWGSMIKARALSLPAGLGIGFAIGNHDAWSAKIAPKSWFGKFSTFERAGATIGRGFYEKFPPQGVQAETWKAGIAQARALSPHTTTVANDMRRVRFASNTVYELMLSSAVAFGFYLTSHAFARRRDERMERRELAQQAPTHPVISALPEASNDNPPTRAANDDTPGTRVMQAQHEPMQQSLPPVAAL
jgi:hypothetical protein